MIRRKKPTVYRKHGQQLTTHTFKLTQSDVTHLERIRTAYEDRYGFSVSTSIIIGVALQSLADEVRAGTIRSTPDLYVSKPMTN